jgi:hypothetical protein
VHSVCDPVTEADIVEELEMLDELQGREERGAAVDAREQLPI